MAQNHTQALPCSTRAGRAQRMLLGYHGCRVEPRQLEVSGPCTILSRVQLVYSCSFGLACNPALGIHRARDNMLHTPF